MGEFRQGGNRNYGRPSTRRDDRNGGGFGGGRGGNRGGFGGGRGRDSDRGDRRQTEMFNTVCSKCGNRCQVPFKPTGSKPVYCSDCFREIESSSSNNFSSRNDNKSQSNSNTNSKQLDQINAKLDKILLILSDLELDTDEVLIDDEVEEDAENLDDEDELDDDDQDVQNSKKSKNLDLDSQDDA